MVEITLPTNYVLKPRTYIYHQIIRQLVVRGGGWNWFSIIHRPQLYILLAGPSKRNESTCHSIRQSSPQSKGTEGAWRRGRGGWEGAARQVCGGGGEGPAMGGNQQAHRGLQRSATNLRHPSARQGTRLQSADVCRSQHHFQRQADRST